MKIIIWIVIFAAGFYVGHVSSSLFPSSQGRMGATAQTPSAKATDTSKPSTTTVSSGGDTAPVVVETSTLSASQKALVLMFGIDSDTITITPTMISCAYGKLGEQRVTEIVAGSKPGALEVVSVLPCLK